MTQRKALAIVGLALACTLAVSACGSGAIELMRAQPGAHRAGSCERGTGFVLSLVSDRGGRPTPVLAASWFSRHGGVPGIPRNGWRQVSRHGKSAEVTSGQFTLHVIEGPDRTWQVDSGRRCS